MYVQELQYKGILANVISYNATIRACEKGQQPQYALQLLQEMKYKGILPNVISYNTTISACEKGSRRLVGVSMKFYLF